MGIIGTYRLRLLRKKWRLRALRKRRELTMVSNNLDHFGSGDVTVMATVHNERIRLPYFLQYYRDMGVAHFMIIDNNSDDGSREFLSQQPDVTLWSTKASYKRSRFGMDWINWLARRYCHNRWVLVVDCDEFFVYPFCDTRPIRALTDWLDASSIRTFGTLLLDMYPKGDLVSQHYHAGQDPLEIANWFDSGNYSMKRNARFGNLWIQGGPRARMFFSEIPEQSPALNKIPLVRWDRRYVFASSTHMLLPRGLNLVYDEWGGEKASGCLLHTKFLNLITEKAKAEMERGEHYGGSKEYIAYRKGIGDGTDMWCQWSEQYINWRQLEILGLMSKGNWA